MTIWEFSNVFFNVQDVTARGSIAPYYSLRSTFIDKVSDVQNTTMDSFCG